MERVQDKIPICLTNKIVDPQVRSDRVVKVDSPDDDKSARTRPGPTDTPNYPSQGRGSIQSRQSTDRVDEHYALRDVAEPEIRLSECQPSATAHQIRPAIVQPGGELRLESFIKILHGRSHGVVALCEAPQEGSWKQEFVETAHLVQAVVKRIGREQQYLSLHPLHERAYSRRADDIATLAAFFVDLDTYNVEQDAFPKLAPLLERVRSYSPKGAADAILSFVSESDIPPPTLIVFTGRGLQVIWVIDPLHLNPTGKERDVQVGMWGLIEGELLSLFRPFGADQQAINLTQVVRLPETVNRKGGNWARVLYVGETNYTFRDFEHLADPAAVKTLHHAGHGRIPRRRDKSTSPRMRVIKNVLDEAIDFLSRQYPDGLKPGLRHAAVHTIARAYRFSANPKSWEHEANAWAKANTNLPDCEIDSILRSLRKTQNGFSPKRAAKALGVTTRLADRYGYIRLRPTRLSLEQAKARKADLRRKSRRARGVKERQPSAMPGLSRAVGISLRSLYRHTDSMARQRAKTLWRDGRRNDALKALGPRIQEMLDGSICQSSDAPYQEGKDRRSYKGRHYNDTLIGIDTRYSELQSKNNLEHAPTRAVSTNASHNPGAKSDGLTDANHESAEEIRSERVSRPPNCRVSSIGNRGHTDE